MAKLHIIAMIALIAIVAVAVNPAAVLAKTTAKNVEAVVDSVSIDINSATTDDFQTIKGIGPKLAERIIEYRGENGSFETCEDIMHVRGIGAQKFEKIKQYITV